MRVLAAGQDLNLVEHEHPGSLAVSAVHRLAGEPAGALELGILAPPRPFIGGKLQDVPFGVADPGGRVRRRAPAYLVLQPRARAGEFLNRVAEAAEGRVLG